MIANRKQFVIEVLILWEASNKITQQFCYNREDTREEILANNYVSIFNSHDIFIQIICSIWNHLLLALLLKQKRLHKRI